jgi:MFS family permease
LIESDIRTDVVAADNTIVYMAGVAPEGNVIARAENGGETWRSSISGRPREIALAKDRTFVITESDELVTASPTGDVETLATGAGHLSGGGKSQDGRSAVVWVTFPGDGRIASWTQDGQRESVVETADSPEAIVALNATERVFVSAGGELLAIGSKDGRVQERIEGEADLVATVPQTGIVWAASGRQLRAIEPNSAAVIGSVTAPIDPDVLSADQGGHRLLAFKGDQMSCAQGRPQFAWRLPSAIGGALIVAFVFLLSLRLIGNRWAALLAALLIGVDGLTFAITRIGTIDGVGTALLLVAWFCALSALFHWGRRDPEGSSDTPVLRRGPAIMWLVAGGFFAGLTTATKWTGFYAWAGIGLLFVADWIGRRERSIWFVLPNVLGPAIILASFVALPMGVYVATFVPYFSLGHTFGEFLSLQSNIFNYHSDLNATHSFGSSWYQWPFGRKAVYLFVSQTGFERQELWTIPNLVLFWGGLVAMVAVVRRAIRTSSTALGIIAFAAIIQYVTWIPIGRVTFLYHYLPVVPFLAIALGWWLVVGLSQQRRQREIAIAFVTAAVAFFGLFLPMLEGWNMPFGYLDWARSFLPWVFR